MSHGGLSPHTTAADTHSIARRSKETSLNTFEGAGLTHDIAGYTTPLYHSSLRMGSRVDAGYLAALHRDRGDTCA